MFKIGDYVKFIDRDTKHVFSVDEIRITRKGVFYDLIGLAGETHNVSHKNIHEMYVKSLFKYQIGDTVTTQVSLKIEEIQDQRVDGNVHFQYRCKIENKGFPLANAFLDESVITEMKSDD